MKLLILDNYDSFTYNLVHLVEKVSDIKFDVFKNDRIGVADVAAYDKILLSPGPGLPSEAGLMPDIIKTYAGSRSILGICLGLQAIGENFGCPLQNLSTVFHGVATPIKILERKGIFRNCPHIFNAGRYHSWVLDNKKINGQMLVTAVDENDLVMAARHKVLDVQGVQFHPESVLSEFGELIIKNWLS